MNIYKKSFIVLSCAFVLFATSGQSPAEPTLLADGYRYSTEWSLDGFEFVINNIKHVAPQNRSALTVDTVTSATTQIYRLSSSGVFPAPEFFVMHGAVPDGRVEGTNGALTKSKLYFGEDGSGRIGVTRTGPEYYLSFDKKGNGSVQYRRAINNQTELKYKVKIDHKKGLVTLTFSTKAPNLNQTVRKTANGKDEYLDANGKVIDTYPTAVGDFLSYKAKLVWKKTE